MTVGPRRVAAATVVAAALSVVFGSLPLSARGSPGGGDPGQTRQLKMQGFAPVSGTYTNKKGKQVRFDAIAYREKAPQSEATGEWIRTWGQGDDGRFECMLSLADIQNIRFIACPEDFPKRAACATVEARNGSLHQEESFRSDLNPSDPWLFLILRTEKGKEVAIGLDRKLADSWIEFDG